LKKDSQVICLLGKIQRDPAVYGEDANEFRPERMLDEHFNKLPKHAWKVRLPKELLHYLMSRH
jgi:cytochrome P450/NADPH-cytochrome P450 reductase